MAGDTNRRWHVERTEDDLQGASGAAGRQHRGQQATRDVRRSVCHPSARGVWVLGQEVHGHAGGDGNQEGQEEEQEVSVRLLKSWQAFLLLLHIPPDERSTITWGRRCRSMAMS